MGMDAQQQLHVDLSVLLEQMESRHMIDQYFIDYLRDKPLSLADQSDSPYS